jgi:hypothetical protein
MCRKKLPNYEARPSTLKLYRKQNEMAFKFHEIQTKQKKRILNQTNQDII